MKEIIQTVFFHTYIASALSKDYFSIYCVDLKNDNYAEYRSHARHAGLIRKKRGEKFFDDCKKKVNRFVYADDQERVLSVFDKTRILNEIAEGSSDLFVCRIIQGNRIVHIKVKITRLKRHGKNCLVVGISNVDSQVRRRIEYERAKEEKLTLSRIAQTLARDYFSIYYIDANTSEYIEYSSHFDYKDLKIENQGEDFFQDCERNIFRVIHKDDRKKLLIAMRRETLIEETKDERIFTTNYRLLMGGKPIYTRLKALRLDDEDGHHILIGVENIDEQVKRERYYEEELSTARELAKEDSLTGVKNKRAYDEKEKHLNRSIASGKDVEFSVVVCDINDLKLVNDKTGHKAGDEYIKKASEVISDVFKDIPVYRVGGDEFVLILEGEYYSARYELVGKMSEKMRDNRDDGEIVVACGIADYEQGDVCVEDVFDRADEAMYKDKKRLKNGK